MNYFIMANQIYLKPQEKLDEAYRRLKNYEIGFDTFIQLTDPGHPGGIWSDKLAQLDAVQENKDTWNYLSSDTQSKILKAKQEILAGKVPEGMANPYKNYDDRVAAEEKGSAESIFKDWRLNIESNEDKMVGVIDMSKEGAMNLTMVGKSQIKDNDDFITVKINDGESPSGVPINPRQAVFKGRLEGTDPEKRLVVNLPNAQGTLSINRGITGASAGSSYTKAGRIAAAQAARQAMRDEGQFIDSNGISRQISSDPADPDGAFSIVLDKDKHEENTNKLKYINQMYRQTIGSPDLSSPTGEKSSEAPADYLSYALDSLNSGMDINTLQKQMQGDSRAIANRTQQKALIDAQNALPAAPQQEQPQTPQMTIPENQSAYNLGQGALGMAAGAQGGVEGAMGVAAQNVQGARGAAQGIARAAAPAVQAVGQGIGQVGQGAVDIAGQNLASAFNAAQGAASKGVGAFRSFAKGLFGR